jgi:hypothetical protein
MEKTTWTKQEVDELCRDAWDYGWQEHKYSTYHEEGDELEYEDYDDWAKSNF